MPERGLEVTGFYNSATNAVSYVVADPISNRAAVIDPVLDFEIGGARTTTDAADRIIEYVRQENLVVDWVLETHVHDDHLSAAPHVQDGLGGTLATGDGVREVQRRLKEILNLEDFPADGSEFGHLFGHGESFEVGEVPAKAYHMPGHTPGCVTYLIGDAAFVGDTVYMPDNGTPRCDMPGGDARELFRSVRALQQLPPETRVFTAHDPMQRGRDVAWESTIEVQIKENRDINEETEEEAFVEFRERRDRGTPKPVFYFQALQINMRGGRFPEPESNGTAYMKIPLDALAPLAKPFKPRIVK